MKGAQIIMISSAQISNRTSKNGKEYVTLDVVFKNGYKKVVFLDTAEQYMLKSLEDNKNNERR